MQRIVLVLLLACSACGEEELQPGRVQLEPGHEPDPWSEAPTPTRALVEKELSDGSRSTLHDGPAPLEQFSLGKGGVGSFVVSGLDDAGQLLVGARSLPVSPAGLASKTLPLFVSRAGRFARPAGELLIEQGERPPSSVVGGRYLLLAGGADGERVALDGYDLGAWSPIAPPPSLGCPAPPCAFRSLAVVAGSRALAIGDDWAIWFDLSDATSGDVARPAELPSFADVAGGATLVAPDGGAYVLGATRASPPTAWVLHASAEGELSALALATPRAGAAATWVPGRGLLVVGGSESGAGAELLAEGSQAFLPLAFPPDPTRGAAAVALDTARVLRLGGRDAAGAPAASVELDLGCGANCQPSDIGAALALDRTSAFALGGERALAVGDDAAGETAVWVVEGTSNQPRPLREPRRGASVLAAPTGHVAIVGGVRTDGAPARTIELYFE